MTDNATISPALIAFMLIAASLACLAVGVGHQNNAAGLLGAALGAALALLAVFIMAAYMASSP